MADVVFAMTDRLTITANTSPRSSPTRLPIAGRTRSFGGSRASPRAAVWIDSPPSISMVNNVSSSSRRLEICSVMSSALVLAAASATGSTVVSSAESSATRSPIGSPTTADGSPCSAAMATTSSSFAIRCSSNRRACCSDAPVAMVTFAMVRSRVRSEIWAANWLT